MCEQVSVGVCDLRLIRSSWASLPWAISGPVTLSPLSDPCGVCSVWSVCGRRLRSVPVPRFLSPAASWTPIAGPWLPIASLRYPPQPYGKLRFCLRKAPRLPTEAPPLPYGSSASALRKAPFSSRCVLLLVINSLFRNWILPSSLWHDVYNYNYLFIFIVVWYFVLIGVIVVVVCFVLCFFSFLCNRTPLKTRWCISRGLSQITFIYWFKSNTCCSDSMWFRIQPFKFQNAKHNKPIVTQAFFVHIVA